MYAILRAGGKQLKVAPGDVVRIEKPSEKVSKGESSSFPTFFSSPAKKALNRAPAAGSPSRPRCSPRSAPRRSSSSRRSGRKQYRRTKGHRQSMIQVRIDGIEG